MPHTLGWKPISLPGQISLQRITVKNLDYLDAIIPYCGLLLIGKDAEFFSDHGVLVASWGHWCTKLLNTLSGAQQWVHPKGNQPWIFTRRTDAEAEAPILWPPDAEGQLIGKDPDAGKDWGHPWEERGDRGWEGWMASLTQWTWVWANAGRWRRTGKPGVLQFMGSQSRTWLSDWTTTDYSKSFTCS